MKHRVYFDSNVLLDFFFERGTTGITELFESIDQKKIIGFVSISSIQICIYFLEKSKGLEAAKAILEMIILNFELLEANKNTLIKAIKSDFGDLEDALQYFTAFENDISVIVTSDKGFLKKSSPILPIISPQEFSGMV